MTKIAVTWENKDQIELNHPKLGKYLIPAVHFFDVARKGMALLREHQFGTYIDDKEVSIAVKPTRDPEGMFIVDIFWNDVCVFTVWCDHISRYGGNCYTFDMKGQSIGSVVTQKVKIDERLKEFSFQIGGQT